VTTNRLRTALTLMSGPQPTARGIAQRVSALWSLRAVPQGIEQDRRRTRCDQVPYSHLLPDLQLKERAAARIDAVLAGENSGQNSGQNQENLVSREGIEPSTRRLRVCCSAN
jgi:hypothetical protein